MTVLIEKFHNRISISIFLIIILILSSTSISFGFTATGSELSAGLKSDYTSRSFRSGNIEYITIGPQLFESAAEPLLEWKTKKGVPAKYKSLEDIYSEFASAGSDELHKIREYLKSEYAAHPELEWVLLLGDSDKIPIRKLFAGAEEYNMLQFYDSDHYLCALNGTWDSDSDGIYGEQVQDEDWDSELYVGRIPVSTSSEATTAINKILNYERTPPSGDWYTRALILGSLMDAPNIPDLPDTPSIDEGYNDYKDNAYEVKKKSLDFFPSRFSLTELYDYDQIPGGEYTLENDKLNRDSMVAEFNSGYALINFAGQARFNGDSLMQYEYSDGTGTYQFHRYVAWRDLYRYEDAQAAKNGGMLPFMMMPTCDAANFTEDKDTNLELLFTAPSGGVIGFISSTGVSHRGESFDGNSYGNWWEDEQFWKIFFQNDIYRPGEALAELKSSFANNILANADTNPRIYREAIIGNLEGLTLLGDPEVPIWTNIPKELSVEFTNLSTGSVTIEAIVTDSETKEPVQNAVVVIQNDEIYIKGSTDASGRIKLSTEITKTGSVNLTVTAHNYLPFEKTETITYAEPKIKQISDITIFEDEPVEDYFKLADIVNDADTLFEELIITLSSSETECGVSLDEDYALDIKPEENWYGTSAVSISVSDGIYTVHLNFTINVTSVNDAPVLYGIPESVSVYENELLVMTNISAADPDSLTLTFFDNTDLFEVDKDTGRFSLIPTNDDGGEYQICISATDGTAVTTECFDLFILSLPDAPTISPIGKLTASTGSKFQFQIEAFDDDGDNLTYDISPDWIKIDSDTGQISFTPNSNMVGTHDVTVTVSDGTHSTKEEFSLQVTSEAEYKNIFLIVGYIALGLLLALGFVMKFHKTASEDYDKAIERREKNLKSDAKISRKKPEISQKKNKKNDAMKLRK